MQIGMSWEVVVSLAWEGGTLQEPSDKEPLVLFWAPTMASVSAMGDKKFTSWKVQDQMNMLESHSEIW